ncbi:hypothetical protein LXL04_039275 [Taraxacum kok-saghyz]
MDCWIRVDLANDLQEYLLKICSGEITGGEDDSHLSVNFAEVIKAIHGPDGGFNAPSRTKRRSPCWGNIVDLSKPLLKHGIDLNNLFSESQGCIVWNLESSGIFTVGSLRRHIDESSLASEIKEWNWHKLLPRKVNILTWRLAHGWLPTKVNLTKRGIRTNESCVLCHTGTETENHLFAECPVAVEVWSGLRLWWNKLSPLLIDNSDMTKWSKEPNGDKENLQAAVILTYIWVLWSHRNKKTHTNSLESHKGLANEIQSLSHLWISSRIRKRKIEWKDWRLDPQQLIPVQESYHIQGFMMSLKVGCYSTGSPHQFPGEMNTNEASTSGSGKFHTVQPIRDLKSNWEVDLANDLQEYLLKICSGEITGGQMKQHDKPDNTPNQEEETTPGVTPIESDDSFWVSDDIPIDAKNSLDRSKDSNTPLNSHVKPPANLVVLEGDCLDTSGDSGELESYLLATNDLYKDFILLDGCDAITVDEFLSGNDETNKNKNNSRGSSIGSKSRKTFMSPSRRSGGLFMSPNKRSAGKGVDPGQSCNILKLSKLDLTES